jgi:hypothetical protein
MRQKQMTTPIFTVEKISNVEIEVVHEEGHHFTFPLVIDKNGRRVLSEGGNVSNGELAKIAAPLGEQAHGITSFSLAAMKLQEAFGPIEQAMGVCVENLIRVDAATKSAKLEK